MSQMPYYKKANNRTLKRGLSYSLGCHALVFALFYGWVSVAPAPLSEGNPAIRAIIIPSRIVAAPPVASGGFERPREKTFPPMREKQIKQKRHEKALSQAHAQVHEKEKRDHSRRREARRKQDVITSRRHTQVTGSTQSNNTTFAATPSPIHRKQPEYPMRAQTMRIEGKVRVQYDVSAQGRVINIRILEAKPNAIFNQSVQRAMRHWKYEAREAKDLTITIIFKHDTPVMIQTA